jgi:hypothetical protein
MASIFTRKTKTIDREALVLSKGLRVKGFVLQSSILVIEEVTLDFFFVIFVWFDNSVITSERERI